MKTSQIILTVVAATFICVCSVVVAAQKSEDGLVDTMVIVKPQPTSLSAVLRQIAADYQIPIGFEQITPDGWKDEPDVHLTHGPVALKDALNEITSEDPRYSWALRDNVINVFPRVEQFDILNVQVKRFRSNSPDASDLACLIFEIESVRISMSELHLEPMNIRVGSLGGGWEKRVKIDIQNISLRTLLNRIAVESEDHYWVTGTWGGNQMIGF
jgi:hypothetical protein